MSENGEAEIDVDTLADVMAELEEDIKREDSGPDPEAVVYE